MTATRAADVPPAGASVIMGEIRYLDELARGRAMAKILRG
ncbi:DUF2200 domain-containing protein [Egicoccus halophilus]|uniref:Uncharacterized protein n=1 Tax=Egicoccus halophilus TaxID=1670830 RepID=A0A8J3ABC4_9ACTN|nr:DUF2200 domain-containing protein [Egicoccus halophilus]GGI09812.1 hypothetical protein GCM10011354_35930 [Egicoccus halophilus]